MWWNGQHLGVKSAIVKIGALGEHPEKKVLLGEISAAGILLIWIGIIELK